MVFLLLYAHCQSSREWCLCFENSTAKVGSTDKLIEERGMALPHHCILCFSRFGVALRPTNTFHPHFKSDYIWLHKRTASRSQGSGTNLFCRRNSYQTHEHIYTTTQARARTQCPKLDYLASSGCKIKTRLSWANGLYIFIFLVSLKVESIHIKAPPFGKHQSLLKNYSEMPLQTTPQAAESRHLPCASDPNSSLWEVSQDPHCFD